MRNLTPTQIVAELDRFIIGQAAAKRAVAVAIRNRWRRQQLPAEQARDVFPKNILMIGPTGVGKTEIARRLATLTAAPFVKVEASKYTEVGYHGRDVESMVRDLVEQAVTMVRAEQATIIAQKATDAANERIVDLLLPSPSPMAFAGSGEAESESSDPVAQSTRNRLLEQVASGSLDARQIELVQTHKPQASSMFAGLGLEQMDPDMASMFDRLIPEQSKRRRVTIEQARRILVEQETDKLLDREKILAQAIERTQNDGIIFIDEIDKIAMGSGKDHGPDVSRQGVQRDLLPIVEGSSVTTKHGVVNTDHILFIAAGAFHVAAVSDLMPELQGRFPIRVELSPLTREDFVRILTEPDNALTKQQHKLLAAEGLEVTFEPGSIDAIADLAAQANATLENIGARRLMTIVEKVFEQINFEAPDMVAQGKDEVVITESFVRSQVQPLMKDQKKSRFWL